MPSGRLYNTGIDLANDSIFSSPDGGVTWDKGTPYCHDGDRPWLAGGAAGQVFMNSNTLEGDASGQQIFVSTDGGNTCSTTGISDVGTMADGTSYTGNGKLYYVKQTQGFVDPGRLQQGREVRGRHRHLEARRRGGHAAPGDHGHLEVRPLVGDRARQGGHVYLVWDTDDRQAGTNGGCCGRNAGAELDPDALHEGPRQDVVEAGHDRRAVERPRLLAVDRRGRRRARSRSSGTRPARASSPTSTARPPTSTRTTRR